MALSARPHGLWGSRPLSCTRTLSSCFTLVPSNPLLHRLGLIHLHPLAPSETSKNVRGKPSPRGSLGPEQDLGGLCWAGGRPLPLCPGPHPRLPLRAWPWPSAPCPRPPPGRPRPGPATSCLMPSGPPGPTASSLPAGVSQSLSPSLLPLPPSLPPPHPPPVPPWSPCSLCFFPALCSCYHLEGQARAPRECRRLPGGEAAAHPCL